MKILISYDGSKSAENALDGLPEAGFADADQHEVLIVVSDVWLPETAEESLRARVARRRRVEMSGTGSNIPARRRLEEERFLSREASGRLSSVFPSWRVRVETLPGTSLASSEVLERAETWGADRIILGATDDSAAVQTARRGTGAARVAAEAPCAVRIVGGRNAPQTKAGQTKEKRFKESSRPEIKVSPAAVSWEERGGKNHG